MSETHRTTALGRRTLQQIVAGMHEGVLLIEPAGPIVWANAAATAMHGCRTPEELGTTATAYRERFILHDAEARRLPAHGYPVARLLAGETFDKETVAITPRDGDAQDRRIIEMSGMAVTGADGSTELLALVMDDITERFDAEERFERAFAANPAPAILLRLEDSRFIKVNDGFMEMTGYERDDIIGHPLREHDLLRHAEHREQAIRALEEHATIPQQESALKTRDGSEKFVILAGQPIQVNDKQCMMFTFIDLDERKKAETDLRHSEERFSRAFQLAPVPMLVCRREGWSVIEVNEAFMRATGRPHEAIVGRSALEAGLQIAEPALEAMAAALDAGGGIRNRDITVDVEGGGVIDGLLSAEPVTIQDETCILFVVQDITLRKRSEADLVAAIETVMQDASWFSRTLMEKLAQIRHPGRRAGTELDMLTAREREVLEGICKGLTDAEIAGALGLSRNTVRNHVANLYSKIGVNRRSAAVVWGRERGLANY